jgi:hypothetical protein
MEFKTKKAWETFVDKGISEGKTPQQMNKLAGTYDGPEGRFTVHQKEGSNRGWTPANQAVRAKRGAKRTEAGIIQDQIMLDTLKKGGLSDEEARAILAREKAAYTNVKRIAKRWTQDPDIPGDYQAGHETAALKGGGNYGDNARVEIGKSRVGPDGVIRRGNQSRGMLNEFDDSIKPAMAIPREGRGGEDTALKNLLKIDENPNIMDLGLTPQDRQRMKANPSQANEIIQARQNQIAAINAEKLRIVRATDIGKQGSQGGKLDLPNTNEYGAFFGTPGTFSINKVADYLKTNLKGEALGALLDPEVHKKLLEQDLSGAAVEAIKGAAIGGGIQSGLNSLGINPAGITPVVIPLAIKSVANVYSKQLTGKDLEEHVIDQDAATNSSAGSGGYLSSMFGGPGHSEHLAAGSLLSAFGVNPRDRVIVKAKDQKLQQYREYRAGGGDAAVSEGMTRKQVIELGQGNLRVKDRGIQQRADKSGLSFLEQKLYEAGGGKKKQGDNRLSMQQVMEIGQENLTVQEEQLRLNYLF